MTWKIRRDVLEKKKSERSNSALEARAVFLYSVQDLRPDVVTDLWTKSFIEFTCIIAHRFRRELLGEEAHDANSGSAVIARLVVEAVRKVEASDDSSFEDERILALTFATFTKINLDELEAAFPNWDSLKGSKQLRSVRKIIHEWSVNWNLDADWCRDHALSVLRHWIADETLKWAFLSPGTKSQLELKGWRGATSSKIWEVQYSRFGDALSIVGKNLKPFEFRWRGATFEAPAWNYLKEKDTEWRSRTRLRFTVWLSEKELAAIGPLASETASTEQLTSSEFDRALTWRYGAMKKFDAALKTYLGRRRLMRKASKSRHKLVEVDKKPKLQEHIEWAVRYQVGGEGLLQVGSGVRAATGGVQPSTVSRAVEDVLSLVGLSKRPDAKPGRTPGGRNKTPRILRELGR
jgi:hypothetical protein